jgi:hypothetical protein
MVTPGRIVAERPTQALAPRRTGAKWVGRDGSVGWWLESKNSRQVPDQAIVTDHDAVRGHEDTLAEHKGAVLASAQLDRYRLTSLEQASAP